MNFWAIIRVVSIIAFIGFLVVGALFALYPPMFSREEVDPGSAIWHSLSLAFMATVTLVALMIALNPQRYWEMLLPLAVGKAVSSLSSIAWAIHYPSVGFLKINAVIDGSIALIAVALYIKAMLISRSQS